MNTNGVLFSNKEDILSFVRKYITQESIILSEIKLDQKDKYYLFSLIYRIYKKWHEAEGDRKVIRGRKRGRVKGRVIETIYAFKIYVYMKIPWNPVFCKIKSIIKCIIKRRKTWKRMKVCKSVPATYFARPGHT